MRADVAALPNAPEPQPPSLPGAPLTSPFRNITLPEPTPGGPLSLDDAIHRAVLGNLQIQLATQQDRAVRGQILTAIYALLPNMKATFATTANEINLAALGFKPRSLAAFGLPPNAIHTIVKVDTTSAQFSADQVLVNLPDFFFYGAARSATTVSQMNVLNVRGGIVEAVALQYLVALADQAQIANAQALVTADEDLVRHATASHDAGVGTNLDVLRARVELENEQQTLVKAQNAFVKDKIALNRLMGQPADQDVVLVDTVPYADLAELPLEQAKAVAYSRRKDLLALQAEQVVARRARRAISMERLPQLGFNGYYGVLGETHGLYHGVFAAQGVLKIPIFEEGRFRGEREIAAASEIGIARQIDALKVTIDAQIRAAMLDVQSASDLVKVARSNVDLATQALSDTRDRYAAGVDDDLPVIQAQAQLQATQSQLIATEFAYNKAKLDLARNTGVVETQYKEYLGK
ncbi:MAG TPA: TolC family protein [Acidobacteriaceae bacterium]|nr:TolC family protein [Acidobacteriaceae bacterium]